MKNRGIILFAICVFFLIDAVLFYTVISGQGQGYSKKPAPALYEFTAVRRGTLERTVTSSGTISPVSTVKVLPQMSGKVEKIYVDYNDTVRKGDKLAELNTDMLKLKREQQYASYIKAKANYDLQLLNYRNQQALAQKNLISEYDFKVSKTTLDNNAADLAVAEANLRVIDTEINQYAYVTSPIDGIVLDRKINVGDTVVDSSSANSSAIFTLAENLREMQIESNVGELDIVSVRTGQPVRFSPESLSGQSFPGVVETLRLVPLVANNVVSYTVIVKVENHDGSLLPGMTCAMDIIVEQSENALIISNAALRYEPANLSAEKIADMVFNAGLDNLSDEQRQAAVAAREQARTQPGQNVGQNRNTGIAGIMMGQQGGRMGGQRQAINTGQGGRQERNTAAVVMRNLWYIGSDGNLEVMRIPTGITNGTFTELRSTENLEGRQFILREKIQ